MTMWMPLYPWAGWSRYRRCIRWRAGIPLPTSPSEFVASAHRRICADSGIRATPVHQPAAGNHNPATTDNDAPSRLSMGHGTNRRQLLCTRFGREAQRVRPPHGGTTRPADLGRHDYFMHDRRLSELRRGLRHLPRPGDVPLGRLACGRLARAKRNRLCLLWTRQARQVPGLLARGNCPRAAPLARGPQASRLAVGQPGGWAGQPPRTPPPPLRDAKACRPGPASCALARPRHGQAPDTPGGPAPPG